MIEAPPSRDLEQYRELVQRIAASSYLNKSARLTDLLLYLCAKVLDGEAGEIHELELGQEVFGRLAHYDTTADNIVRVHVSMLRKRLNEYFAAEGRVEEFLVEIPRGNYAPQFRKRTPRELVFPNLEAETLSLESLEDISETAGVGQAAQGAARPARRALWERWLLSGLVVSLALLSTFLFLRLQRATTPGTSAALAGNGVVRQFWSQIFHKDDNVAVVLDDASLEVYQQATGHPVALGEYFDRSYLQSADLSEAGSGVDAARLHGLLLKRQSNFADATVLWNLAQIANTLHRNGHVQFARDMPFRQVKSSSLILLGNPQTDPWIQLFESGLSLQWKVNPDTQTSYPVDTTATASQNGFRAAADDSQTREAYATISFLPNLSGTGNVLIVSGTGGAAVDAAMDWMLDPASMDLIESRLPQEGQRSFPYFEALLKIGKGISVPRSVALAICRPVRLSKREAPKSVAGR